MLFAFSLQILYHKKSRLSIPSSKKNAKKCGFSDKIPYFFEKWSFFYFIIKTAARRANWDRQYTCRAKDKTIGLSQNKTYKSYKTYRQGALGCGEKRLLVWVLGYTAAPNKKKVHRRFATEIRRKLNKTERRN